MEQDCTGQRQIFVYKAVHNCAPQRSALRPTEVQRAASLPNDSIGPDFNISAEINVFKLSQESLLFFWLQTNKVIPLEVLCKKFYASFFCSKKKKWWGRSIFWERQTATPLLMWGRGRTHWAKIMSFFIMEHFAPASNRPIQWSPLTPTVQSWAF